MICFSERKKSWGQFCGQESGLESSKVPWHNHKRGEGSSPSRTRTYNLAVNSRSLYHWAIGEYSDVFESQTIPKKWIKGEMCQFSFCKKRSAIAIPFIKHPVIRYPEPFPSARDCPFRCTRLESWNYEWAWLPGHLELPADRPACSLVLRQAWILLLRPWFQSGQP